MPETGRFRGGGERGAESMALKKWVVASVDRQAVRRLAAEAGVPAMTAALLQVRGYTTPQQAQAVLSGEPLHDPMTLSGMAAAVDCIRDALDSGARMAVYGDYDADGVTATVMLYSYLESCGADVLYAIPEREGEGYGLNLHAVETLHAQHVDLLITVDNGITSIPEVARAKELGMRVVITDHHRPLPELPPADAVVDPFLPGDESGCQCLCGAGVAFKLIEALEGPNADVQGLLENYADLLCIATVGDVVPLTGENRTFVRFGLEMLPYTDRLGLHNLLEEAGLLQKPLHAKDVAFGIVPRLNATGRMGSPNRAVRLLLSEDPEEAASLAAEVSDDNDARRSVEEEILSAALSQLREDPPRQWDRVLVVEGENWHPGVIGIVSSRLVEQFGKPCIVLSLTDREARGSGRSVEGFSLFKAVSACAPLLTKYGGHPMAAGMTLPRENVQAFRRQLNAYAASLGELPLPQLCLDAALKPEKLSVNIPRAAEPLEPFGTDNPSPLYGLLGMTVKEIRPLSNGRHVQLTCVRGGVRVRCLRFGVSPQQFPYQAGDVLDLAVALSVDTYGGRERLSVVIKDMRLSASNTEDLAAGVALFEKALREDPLSEQEASRLTPTREDCAGFYRVLRTMGGYQGGAEGIAARAGLPFARVLSCLQLFCEHGLIAWERFGGHYTVTLLPTQGKVDLFDSAYLRGLRARVQLGPNSAKGEEIL